MNDHIDRPEENTYINCIRCGLCLSVCPTYREDLKETASPRGRVALARKGLEGQLDFGPNLYEQMYQCLGCMACDEVCPVGIHPAELALSLRTMQEQTKPKKWKDVLFSGLIPHPNRMESATFPLRIYQGSGIRRLVYAMGLKKLLPRKIRDLEAMLPRIPQRPLRRVLPEITEPTAGNLRQVGFYLGCAQSLLFSEASASVVRVLARNGCRVFTPKDVQCCGMPALGYGRLDLVKNQAKHNIAVFDRYQVETIVTDCATCGSTLKEYGEILEDDQDWAARAADFSAKVRDISEFLAEIPLEKPAGRIEAQVTYHDPCHLARAQDVRQQPRDLLKLIDGLEFKELPEADWCCGSAGSQLITHYDTSLSVLDRKMNNLKDTGAQIIASGCPGCQMQLNVGIQRSHLDVRVVHPITLLDEAYGKSDE
jgi:glycolate oxidase iron-sulfur subunit